jgi:hypothetical protein
MEDDELPTEISGIKLLTESEIDTLDISDVDKKQIETIERFLVNSRREIIKLKSDMKTKDETVLLMTKQLSMEKERSLNILNKELMETITGIKNMVDSLNIRLVSIEKYVKSQQTHYKPRITKTDVRVLRELNKNPMTFSELMKILIMDSSQLNKSLKKMIGLGLVEHDETMKIYMINDEGRKELSQFRL